MSTVRCPAARCCRIFFFQAEDGIRDGRVTGVQTCALPIWLVFVSVAAPEAGNLAITDVILQPPAPARGEEVEVSCKVANYTRLAKSVPVQLKFGGEKPMQHELDVPAGTTASVTFRLRANRAGFFEGELTIPEDSLPVDNRRYFTLTVGERVQ